MTLRHIPMPDLGKDQVFNLYKTAIELGLERLPNIAQALKFLNINPDMELVKIVQEAIDHEISMNISDPNPFRKTTPTSSLPGEIILGNVVESQIPWALSLDQLTNKILITGRSGGGKTNLILLILYQVLQLRNIIKGFDRKGDHRCLSVFPNFLYWTLENFENNWLKPPPGVPYTAWIPILAEILTNFLDIMIASSSQFSNTALWLCEKWDSVQTGIYPTIIDVYKVIKSKKYPAPSHLARYQETITNRLEGLLAVLGKQICSQKKLNWDKYLATNWSIDIHILPTVYQNLFITVTMAKILLYRIHNDLRSATLADLFVFDEAATIFRKWYEARGGTYLLTDYLALSREFGIGFIISTQNLSNLADTILSNSATKIMVGGAGLGADYDIFGSAIGLTQEQKEYLKTLKNPGIACVSDSRYPHPFILEVTKIA